MTIKMSRKVIIASLCVLLSGASELAAENTTPPHPAPVPNPGSYIRIPDGYRAITMIIKVAGELPQFTGQGVRVAVWRTDTNGFYRTPQLLVPSARVLNIEAATDGGDPSVTLLGSTPEISKLSTANEDPDAKLELRLVLAEATQSKK